jgi:predicted acetyltransferase
MPSDLLDISLASIGEAPLLEALFQFYVYDFSEFEDTESDKLAFTEQGTFNTGAPLSAYWSQANRWPYLFRMAGRPAGFALVNTHSHVDNPVDRNMGEFFVARKYRRHGIATRALHTILKSHPGQWEIAIIEPNKVAQKFWPQAIMSASSAKDLRLVNHDGTKWPGPIWTFRSEPKA